MHVLKERRCPKCGSLNVHRSRHRLAWAWLHALRGIIAYRCHDCNTTYKGKKSLKRLYRVNPDEAEM